MNKLQWIWYKFFGYSFVRDKRNFISKDIALANRKSLTHDSYIHIEVGAKIYGNGSLHIEENSIIGPNFTVYTSAHNYRSDMIPYNSEWDIVGLNKIRKNCWIGGNVILLPGVEIGERSIIGAGSVVTKDVAKLTIVAGNPARVINVRDKNKYEQMVRESRFYLKNKNG